MAGYLGDAIGLDQLCRATGVDRETLVSIFANYLGLDPIQYLKVCRLNQVLKALRRADPATIAVADIARAWGFSNLRAFTRDFSEWFESLRQRCFGNPLAFFSRSISGQWESKTSPAAVPHLIDGTPAF